MTGKDFIPALKVILSIYLSQLPKRKIIHSLKPFLTSLSVLLIGAFVNIATLQRYNGSFDCLLVSCTANFCPLAANVWDWQIRNPFIINDSGAE